MTDYIEREAVITYIRYEAKELTKAFDEFGGESGIIAKAYEALANDLEKFYAADVAKVIHAHIVTNWFGDCHCSNCGEYCDSPKAFCASCGARLDESEQREH